MLQTDSNRRPEERPASEEDPVCVHRMADGRWWREEGVASFSSRTEGARSHVPAIMGSTGRRTTTSRAPPPSPARSKFGLASVYALAASLTLIILLLEPSVGDQTLGSQVSESARLDGQADASTVGPSELETNNGTTSTEGNILASPAASQAGNKLRPVNFTLVDELFEASLEEEEVVRRWRNMDSQLQDGMKSILKMIFPQIVAISQDAKVSGDCSGGILKWILSLRNLRSWAIKMLDASGKPTAGIFEGSLTMFGNYRQCLSIRAPDEDEIEITNQFEEYFRGQFCVLHLKPWLPNKRPFYHLNSTIEPLLRKNYKYYEKTLYDELAEIAIAFNFVDIRMDLCVPSTCTLADIQRVAELLSRKLEMRAKVMRCDISPRDQSLLSQMDRATYLWLLVPVTLLCCSMLATILAALPLAGPQSGRGFGLKELRARRHKVKGDRLAAFIECLSVGGAARDRLTQPSNSTLPCRHSGSESPSEQTACHRSGASLIRKPLPLYGLRSLFVLWFIVVQMTVELKYQFLRESLVLRNMIISYWPFQIIVNSALLFESLIVITAFTYSYTCLESTLKDLVGYICDKYLRLILSIVTLIALTIVTPLVAIESPVWRNFVDQQAAVCKATGYLDLFFLQNFISYEKICLPHTWLFCVELQLIVLSAPLLLLLKRTFAATEDSVIIGQESKQEVCEESNSLIMISFRQLLSSKAGCLSLSLVVIGFCVNFFAVYSNKLPPSWFYTFPDVAQRNYYFGLYLTKTWTHLSVFVIGLIGGHLCRSAIQLHSIRRLKEQQERQQANKRPSPSPSNSTCQSQLASSTAIIAMEFGSQQTDDTTSDAQSSMRKARKQTALLRGSLKVAALVCMLAIIFATYSWSTQEAPSPLVAALYNVSSRLGWCLCLTGLMMYLCLPSTVGERHSLTTRLFSHPICTIIGRLSFLAYLLSPYIHAFVLAVEEQSLFPSLLIMFHVIVGNIVIIYVSAFMFAIVIEQPMRRLVSRFLLGNRFRKQKINISTYYVSTPRPIPAIAMPSKSDS